MYCLWKVREDLRSLYDLDNALDRETYIWWYIRAASTDPDFEAGLHEDHWRRLCTPSPEVTQDFGFKISVMMHHLHSTRPDLREEFDLSERAGREAFIMWYLFYGIGDPKSFVRISEPEYELLTAPAPAPAATVARDTDPPISNAMYLFWLWHPEARSIFDLGDAAGRREFTAWFHAVVVNEFPLWWLLTEPVRRALLTIAPWDETAPEIVGVPRCAAWIWTAHADLARAFPKSNSRSPARFLDWLSSDAGRDRFPTMAGLLSPPPGVKPNREVVAGRRLPQAPVIAAGPRRRASDGVTLVGFARGVLGIGEDLRMMFRALTCNGVKHSIVDIQPSSLTANFDQSVAHLISDDVEYETCVFVLTAMETARIMAVDGPARFHCARSIGYWPWEFDEWPPEWRFAGKFVDEIWASTRFTARAYETGTDRPVRRMPMAVELPEFAKASRDRFGLPERDFLFIFAFDINSSTARKNPMGAVDAFLRAFPRAAGVGLVIKVSNYATSSADFQHLRAIAADDPRIHIIHRTLTKAEWIALLDVCDCFVSLHRSEGFERILAEAMLLEKPVIATNYSGNVDFLTKRTVRTAVQKSATVAAG